MNIATSDAEVQAHLKSLTLLYVEDEMDARTQFSLFLERIVGTLITAKDGEEGFKAYREHNPDIVITDVKMPIMSGLDMLKEIRRIDEDKLVPTIILTAFEEVEYLESSIDLHAYSYLTKPIDAQKLLKSLTECACRLLDAKKLRQAHEFIETIVENVRPPLIVLDSELKILFANDNFYDTLKLMSEETVGNSIYDLGERQWNIPELRQLFENLLSQNVSFIDYEIESYFPNIGHKVFLFSARQVIWQSASTNIILLSIEDITKRKLYEVELIEKARFMQHLADNIPDTIGYWTKDLRCSFSNAAYKEWFGKTREEMQGIHAHELLGDEVFNKSKPYHNAVLQGETLHLERELTKSDGSKVNAWMHYIPDVFNNQVQGFFVLISDVSELKQAQFKLEQANLELCSTSEQLASVLESATDVIAMMDNEYRYTLFNKTFHDEFLRIFGKDLNKGASMVEALEQYPEDLANGMAFWSRALSGEDFTVIQQFGSEELERHWYELHFSPIRDSIGKITGAVHVVRNITERKQVEEERDEAVEKLKKSEELFRNLVESSNDCIWEVNKHSQFVYAPLHS